MNRLMTAVALSALVGTGSALAQTPPPVTPPPAQNPPARPPTTPPAAQTPPATPPAAPAAPAVPFPAGAKFAVVDLQLVAQRSKAGKAASAQLQKMNDLNNTELQGMQTQLDALRQQRVSQAGIANEKALADMDARIDRLTRDMQRKQQDAQADAENLNKTLMTDFQQKVLPIINAIAAEKGIEFVFSAGDTGFLYVKPGLDITDEVVKRLDAPK